MLDAHIDTSAQGAAFLGRRSEGTVRALVADLIERYPSEDADKLFERFEKALDVDPEHERALRLYAFTNFFRYEVRKAVAANEVAERIGAAREKRVTSRNESSFSATVEREVRGREVEKETVKAGVAQIQLLFLTMPNGKALRDCTFREVEGFGKGYAKLAKGGPPLKMVGEELNEEQVRELMKPTA